MKALMVVLVLSAFVAAPALVLLPEASACQPYEYYCPIDGRSYWACSGKVPSGVSACVMRALEP
jgi:hypothetical protein